MQLGVEVQVDPELHTNFERIEATRRLVAAEAAGRPDVRGDEEAARRLHGELNGAGAAGAGAAGAAAVDDYGAGVGVTDADDEMDRAIAASLADQPAGGIGHDAVGAADDYEQQQIALAIAASLAAHADGAGAAQGGAAAPAAQDRGCNIQ